MSSSKKTRKPRRVSDLRTEELLEALENAPETTDIIDSSYTDEAIRFLNTYNIKSGRHRVNQFILRRLYSVFVRRPVTQSEVNKTLEAFLNKKGTYYFLNTPNISLTNLYIKYLQTRPTFKSSTVKTQKFNLFLNEYDIKPGNFYVSSSALFFIFKCIEAGRTSVYFPQFVALMSNNFTPKYLTHNEVSFGIDKTSFRKHITEEQQDYAEKECKKLKGRIPSTQQKEEFKKKGKTT